ncbi:ParB/RepB/Spo0J family partition protein [Dyella sp.]|uniref:ParB/RepB/Spo0J family partition protein n=1 Tax=Dyella sp. TaxID=1869338 RepID=UPI002C9B4B4F|nr:ParB/RepB/Spo0J family partition protein [Rhodanobacteraceae bacterium]
MALDLSSLSDVGALLRAQDEGKGLRRVRVDVIHPDPNQPRKTFDQESLDELAESIRANGIIQPPVVRGRDDGYLLIAGERRWRAARQLRLEMIDVIVRDDLSARAQLVENIQRQELTHWEIYRVVSAELASGTTHAELARSLGKSRTWVTAYAAVDNMPEPIVSALREGRITDITTLAHLHRLHDARPAAATALLNSSMSISRSMVERARGEAQLSCSLDSSMRSLTSTGKSDASEPQQAIKATRGSRDDNPLAERSSLSKQMTLHPPVRIFVFYDGTNWIVDYHCQQLIDGVASVRLESEERGSLFAPLAALKLQSIEWI